MPGATFDAGSAIRGRIAEKRSSGLGLAALALPAALLFSGISALLICLVAGLPRTWGWIIGFGAASMLAVLLVAGWFLWRDRDIDAGDDADRLLTSAWLPHEAVAGLFAVRLLLLLPVTLADAWRLLGSTMPASPGRVRDATRVLSEIEAMGDWIDTETLRTHPELRDETATVAWLLRLDLLHTRPGPLSPGRTRRKMIRVNPTVLP